MAQVSPPGSHKTGPHNKWLWFVKNKTHTCHSYEERNTLVILMKMAFSNTLSERYWMNTAARCLSYKGDLMFEFKWVTFGGGYYDRWVWTD